MYIIHISYIIPVTIYLIIPSDYLIAVGDSGCSFSQGRCIRAFLFIVSIGIDMIDIDEPRVQKDN